MTQPSDSLLPRPTPEVARFTGSDPKRPQTERKMVCYLAARPNRTATRLQLVKFSCLVRVALLGDHCGLDRAIAEGWVRVTGKGINRRYTLLSPNDPSLPSPTADVLL
jgi:hypothetical protein